MVVETRSVEHAKQMFRVLHSQYSHMTLVGVGGAKNHDGMNARSDSGQYSDDSDTEEILLSAQAI